MKLNPVFPGACTISIFTTFKHTSYWSLKHHTAIRAGAPIARPGATAIGYSQFLAAIPLCGTCYYTGKPPALLFKGRNLRTAKWAWPGLNGRYFFRGNDSRQCEGLVLGRIFNILDRADGSVHRRHWDQISFCPLQRAESSPEMRTETEERSPACMIHRLLLQHNLYYVGASGQFELRPNAVTFS